MHIKSSNSRPPSRLMFDIERVKHEIPQFSSSPAPNSLPALSAGDNLMQTSSLYQLQKTTFDELWQVFGHMLLGLLQHQNMNFPARSVSSNNYQQEVQDLMRTMYESMQEKNDEIPVFGRTPPTGDEVLCPQTRKNCNDDLENKTYCKKIESFDKPDNHFNIEHNPLSPLNKEHENVLANTAFKIPLRRTSNDSIKTVSDENSSDLSELNSDNVESRPRRNHIRPNCNVKMKLRKRLDKNHKTKVNIKKTDVYLGTQVVNSTETAVDFLNSLGNSNIGTEVENSNIETETMENGKSIEEITQQEDKLENISILTNKSSESLKNAEKFILNSHIEYSSNKKRAKGETTTKEINSESYATESTQNEDDSVDIIDTDSNIFTNINDSDNSIESLVIDETTRSMETCQTGVDGAAPVFTNLKEIEENSKTNNNANNVMSENEIVSTSMIENTNINNSNEQRTVTEILSKGASKTIADILSCVKNTNIELTDADRRQVSSESETKNKTSSVTVQDSVFECSYLRGKYTRKRCKEDYECIKENTKLAKIFTHNDDNSEPFSHVNVGEEPIIIVENNSYMKNANSKEGTVNVNPPLEIKQLPQFSEYEMESPASPLMNTDNETPVIKPPREIPLELQAEFVNDGKRYSLLNDLIECYTPSGSSVKQSQTKDSTKLQEAIDLYMKLKHVTAEYAYDLVQRILSKTKDIDCIVTAIVAQRKQATFAIAESVEPKLPNTLNATQSALSLIVIELNQHWPHFVIQLLAKVDSTLFNCQCAEKLTLDGALNLTQLYLMLISRHLPMCQSNPARLFIAKCLYYHQMKAIPMIYEVLCYYPTVLPHREERCYDRSDALITVIQHSLMCTNYDMDRRDLRTKELLSKLRFEYHFEPFKPDRLEVLRNLMDKLRADKVTHLPYAFAVFCKRQHCAKVTTDVLQAHLMPLANEYYPLLLQSQDYDTRVATLLHCISVVVKPFPLDTDVEPYLCIFERFLHAVPRACVQESSVQAVIRMQRFGYANCYRALLHFKPAHDLHPQTKAMLKTFLHRKSLHFWKTLRSQSLAVDD